MGKAFADRWGVPVRAGSADAVALLDEAIEDLAALAGDPVADAEAAVAADDSLVLGHIYRAYLQLYGTTPEGVAAAGEILKRLDETVMGERELHHLRAARHWVEGDWEATTRSLERALLCHPRDLLALKVAQDLYFFLGNRLELRDTAARVLPAWPRDAAGLGVRAGHLRVRPGGERGLPAGGGSRPGRARPQPEGRVGGARAGARLRDGRQPAGRRQVPHRLGAGLVRELLRRPQLVAPGPVPPGAGRDRRGARAVRRPHPRGAVHRVAGRRGRGRAAVAAVPVRCRRHRTRRSSSRPTSTTWSAAPSTSSTTGTR